MICPRQMSNLWSSTASRKLQEGFWLSRSIRPQPGGRTPLPFRSAAASTAPDNEAITVSRLASKKQSEYTKVVSQMTDTLLLYSTTLRLLSRNNRPIHIYMYRVFDGDPGKLIQEIVPQVDQNKKKSNKIVGLVQVRLLFCCIPKQPRSCCKTVRDNPVKLPYKL